MTGKKRGKKMKAVLRWALVHKNKRTFGSVTYHTRDEARMTRSAMHHSFRDEYRVARVLISEIPSGRGK